MGTGPNVTGPESPDQVVAGRIVQKLIAAGLLTKAKEADAKRRLAAGMKEEEWMLYLDQALEEAMAREVAGDNG